MTTLRNVIANPSFEDSTFSIWTISNATGIQTSAWSQMLKDGERIAAITTDGTASVASLSITSSLYRPLINEGQWFALGAFTATESVSTNYQTRIQIGWRDAAGVALGYFASTWKNAPFYNGDWPTLVLQAPAGTASAAVYVQLRNGDDTVNPMPAGKRMWVDEVRGHVGNTEAEVRAALAEPYWTGDTPGDSKFIYGWDGTPEQSSSYRVERLDLLHSWTRKLWDTLPNAFRMADSVQDPSLGYFPLLRWLNGVGALAGEMRDLSDSIWFNELTDITKTPDAALRWLGQIIGLSADQRAASLTDLRAAIAEITAGGRPAIGTRSSIAEAAKRFLTGDKQVAVVPSSVTPFTIVLLVRSSEVPGGNLTTLVNNVRSTGVVPAGHNLVAQNAVATWDSFMAAAGATWDELDGKAGTWNQHDTIGVVLEA
ncbi:minor tail protein [Arthrobacter phage StevieBAY]|uniref:Minor tail protein n=1 Tax=Arthrobacter phage StevieBAY TaxID=2725609 RepID=A0A6M3T7Q2_9CAUD|nr:minor tail protein [Arthrobacter phage StevieBAY]